MREKNFGFRRSHERKRYGAEVVFSFKNRAYSGVMENLSLGGAFVATASVNQFSTGDLIILSIPFTSGDRHVKRKGRISWMNNEGFALEFI